MKENVEKHPISLCSHKIILKIPELFLYLDLHQQFKGLIWSKTNPSFIIVEICKQTLAKTQPGTGLQTSK